MGRNELKELCRKGKEEELMDRIMFLDERQLLDSITLDVRRMAATNIIPCLSDERLHEKTVLALVKLGIRNEEIARILMRQLMKGASEIKAGIAGSMAEICYRNPNMKKVFGNKRVLSVLRRMAEKSGPCWFRKRSLCPRARAIDLIGEIGGESENRVILKALKGGDEVVRKKARMAAVKMRNGKLVRMLCKGLKDEDLGYVLSTLWILERMAVVKGIDEKLNLRVAIPYIVKIFERAHNVEVESRCVRTLIRIDEDMGVEVLCSLASKSGGNSRIRRRAIVHLGRLAEGGSDAAYNVLKKIVRNEEGKKPEDREDFYEEARFLLDVVEAGRGT